MQIFVVPVLVVLLGAVLIWCSTLRKAPNVNTVISPDVWDASRAYAVTYKNYQDHFGGYQSSKGVRQTTPRKENDNAS
jgi:hypothetical protein